MILLLVIHLTVVPVSLTACCMAASPTNPPISSMLPSIAPISAMLPSTDPSTETVLVTNVLPTSSTSTGNQPTPVSVTPQPVPTASTRAPCGKCSQLAIRRNDVNSRPVRLSESVDAESCKQWVREISHKFPFRPCYHCYLRRQYQRCGRHIHCTTINCVIFSFHLHIRKNFAYSLTILRYTSNLKRKTNELKIFLFTRFQWYNSNGIDVGSTFGSGTVTAMIICNRNNQLIVEKMIVTQVECINA